jgi:hypothetical protein
MLGVFGLSLCFGLLGDGLYSLIFLVFAVCEGRVGLSVLVSSVRSHGRDMLINFSFLEC